MPGSLVLLCGRSFSGKSTIARALADALPAVVVGYDAINAERGLHGGEGVPVAEWMQTDAIAHGRADELLAAGSVVVVDDTSSLRFLRDAWRRLASGSDARFVLVLVDVAPDAIRDRLRANRVRPARPDVADDVMADHLDAFEPPEDDEPHLRFSGAEPTDAVIAAVSHALGGRPGARTRP